MANYDDVEIRLVLSYREMSLVHECLTKQRRDYHNRADSLDLTGNVANESHAASIRRKAAGIYELMQELSAAMSEVRHSVNA